MRGHDIRSYKLGWPVATLPYYIYTLDCFILYQILTDSGIEIQNVFLSSLVLTRSLEAQPATHHHMSFVEMTKRITGLYTSTRDVFCIIFNKNGSSSFL